MHDLCLILLHEDILRGTVESTGRRIQCSYASNYSLSPISTVEGVIHSDLRPENFLVDASTPTSFDLWLCDFGESVCKELDIDGGSLPDCMAL